MRQVRLGRGALLVATGMAVSAVGCTTEDVDLPIEGGSGDSTTGGNTTGSSTTGGMMCEPAAKCEPQVWDLPSVLEFSQDDQFAGGVYSYGSGLMDETVDGEWRISGSVSTYSGFGVAFPCIVDASAFSGVEFTIRGDVGDGSLVLSANTPSNSTVDCEEPHNTCTGACANSQAPVAVTEDARTVSLSWSDFSGGSPNDQPDPAELHSLVWVFMWNDASSPYVVDITVDDIRFTE